MAENSFHPSQSSAWQAGSSSLNVDECQLLVNPRGGIIGSNTVGRAKKRIEHESQYRLILS